MDAARVLQGDRVAYEHIVCTPRTYRRKRYEPMSANLRSSNIKKSCFVLSSCRRSMREWSKSSITSTCVWMGFRAERKDSI